MKKTLIPSLKKIIHLIAKKPFLKKITLTIYIALPHTLQARLLPLAPSSPAFRKPLTTLAEHGTPEFDGALAWSPHMTRVNHLQKSIHHFMK